MTCSFYYLKKVLSLSMDRLESLKWSREKKSNKSIKHIFVYGNLEFGKILQGTDIF